jgi:NAD(P)-dependent dehydrogenase (short-subunit alcohol dehydrogenase family)
MSEFPYASALIVGAGPGVSAKGFPLSSAFAMGKFALRGLAQSAARELGPHGVHVAHFVLDPDGVAQSYIAVLNQPRSAWSWEVELRPWVERF